MKKTLVCLLILMSVVTAQAEVLTVHRAITVHVGKKSVDGLEEVDRNRQIVVVRLGDRLYVFREGVDVMSDGVGADSIPLE